MLFLDAIVCHLSQPHKCVELLSAKSKLSHCCLQKLPHFLQALVELLVAAGIYPPEQAPQHVLVNSYDRGAGIPPHMDGPLYSPCVATITLGGPALMAFHEALPDETPGELASEVSSAQCCGLVCRLPCSAALHTPVYALLDSTSGHHNKWSLPAVV